MYKVNFYKWILDGEIIDIKTSMDNYLRKNPDFDPECEFDERTCLTRQIELPFTPYIGLNIVGEFGGGYFNSGEILTVTWDNDNQCFECILKSEFPTRSWNYDYDHDYLLENAIRSGWTVIVDSNNNNN